MREKQNNNKHMRNKPHDIHENIKLKEKAI